MDILKIKKVRENAKIPTRGTVGSAGLDLYACIDEPITLKKGDTAVIPTGIAIGLDDPHYAAFVYARSGLAIKHGIGLLNSVGVIDSDYRGEICVGVIKQKGLFTDRVISCYCFNGYCAFICISFL